MQNNKNLYEVVASFILEARQQAYRSSNSILLKMYWKIGQVIVEDEQGGRAKAAYGKAILKTLSRQLSLEFGKGFDESNLRNMRSFYLAFPIHDAVRHELSWTHYRMLIRIEDPRQRNLYVQHAIDGNWSTRTLKRNINSQYLGRVVELAENELLFASKYRLYLPSETELQQLIETDRIRFELDQA